MTTSLEAKRAVAEADRHRHASAHKWESMQFCAGLVAGYDDAMAEVVSLREENARLRKQLAGGLEEGQ